MKHQSKPVISMLMLIAIAALLVSPQVAAVEALEEWNVASRDVLATPVKVWLGLMMLTNISAIGFLKNHVAARWVFAGFVISHGLVILMSAQGMSVLAGQVSLFHIIFWTPGMVMLLRCRNEIQYPKAYSIWATLSLIFYFGSMIFDVRDALIYIQHLMG